MAYSRRFAFFEKVPLNVSKENGNFEDVPVTCLTAGSGYLWLGDNDGFMHCIDTSFCLSAFRAHTQPVRQCHQVPNADLLVTVGCVGDETDQEERVRVWNTKKWSLTSKTSLPVLCKSFKAAVGLPTSRQPGEVTCLQVSTNLDAVLLGHSSGLVQLIRGDLTSDRHCRRTIVYDFFNPVTTLNFVDQPVTNVTSVAKKGTKLEHTGSIFNPETIRASMRLRKPPSLAKFEVSGDNADNASLLSVENSTAATTVSVIFASSEHQLVSIVLGKRDQILRTTTLDNFGCRQSCACLVDDSQNPIAANLIMTHKEAVYFYDKDGRGPCLAIDGDKRALCAYKQYLTTIKQSRLQQTASSNNDVQMAEPTAFPNPNTRVTIFEYKNKFVAGEFQVPWAHSIITGWGGLFVLCIEQKPPGSPNPTTVKIFELIEKETQARLDILFSKKSFNLAIAIAKSDNYGIEEMAHIHRRCADHFFIQKQYDSAVKEYIQTIGIVEASYVVLPFLENGLINQLARYLEALHEPENDNFLTADHTALLLNSYARLDDRLRIDSFLTKLSEQKSVSSEFYSSINVLRRAGYPQQALTLARLTGHPTDCIQILIEDLKDAPSVLQEIKGLPFEQSLDAICTYGSFLMGALPSETAELLDRLCSNPKAGRISVKHFLKIFVNNRTGLMKFLERCILKPRSESDSSLVETLLELALFEASEASTSQEEITRLHELAMNILKNSSLPYDEGKALILCHQRSFFDGCLHIWKKNKQYDQILEHYILQSDIDGLMETCETFGNQTPSLWLDALKYVSDKPELSKYLCKILMQIESYNLAPPLVVLQLLTSAGPNKSHKLGSIKAYLLRYLETGKEKVEANQMEMQRLREETLKNREVVRQLKTRVKIFQQQKCVVCSQSLDPPSVHFLCDHSYHKACFDTYSFEDEQCPECAPLNRHLLVEAKHAAGTEASTQAPRPLDLLEQLKHALMLPKQPVLQQHTDESASPRQQESNSAGIIGGLISQGVMQGAAGGKVAVLIQKSPTVETSTRKFDQKYGSRSPILKQQSLADSGIGSSRSFAPKLQRQSTISSPFNSNLKEHSAQPVVVAQRNPFDPPSTPPTESISKNPFDKSDTEIKQASPTYPEHLNPF